MTRLTRRRYPCALIARIALIAGVVGLVFASRVLAAVNFDWVTVGNPANPPDPATGFGSVASAYRISKYETTNAQYAEFLNAKAASDPLTLYNTNMSSTGQGGITRSGPAGSFTYAVKSGYANLPVVWINWFDTVRFVNWIANGQGNGDTESGTYTLLGASPTPTNATTITRNAGATTFLTSENEWYKAAYYDPTKGGAGGYWLYPTHSDAEPVSQPPPGGSNSANYYNAGNAVPSPVYLNAVGAYLNSHSFYGTFDQGGNVAEWDEVLTSTPNRGLRGGSWPNGSSFLRSTFRNADPASLENSDSGFRVASIPEPASGLAIVALLAAAAVSRRAPLREWG